MNADQTQQQTILETLARIEQALAESEPRNAEQTAAQVDDSGRGCAICSWRLPVLPALHSSARPSKTEVYPQLKQAVQDLLRWADEVQASENPPPAEPSTPQPAPQARPEPRPSSGTETPAPKEVAVDFDPPELIRIPAGYFLMGEEPTTAIICPPTTSPRRRPPWPSSPPSYRRPVIARPLSSETTHGPGGRRVVLEPPWPPSPTIP